MKYTKGFFTYMSLIFIAESALIGVGLAMDAFSVSLANGLNEPKMKGAKMSLVAGVFAFFQWLMPLVGWLCVHTVSEHFETFNKLIPVIALVLLCIIGGKMLKEGLECKNGGECKLQRVTLGVLMAQGVATSIDALSVGFTISHYGLLDALICCLTIAITTFAICLAGLAIGKRFGTRLSGGAGILGGCILIFIGIKIFVTGMF